MKKKPGKPRSDVATRFWSYVDKSGGPDACWPWTLSHAKGRNRLPYGRFQLLRDKGVLTHRMAYQLATGEDIPKGLCVMHSCDNAKCCNPKHLSIGTHAENIRQRDERGRTAKGLRGGRTKLTVEQVLEIRDCKDSWAAMRERHGVQDGTIWSIKVRRNWAHVPERD